MLNLPDTGHSWTENWLFKLANDNATFLYLSLSDVTYSSNFYEGAVINKPSIRESINLSNSTAKTGNISIQIADYNYNGSPISEELFGGSNHYINQTVTVHSKINAETPIQIGTFRLTDISTDGDKITLSLASHRPWDFISIPQDKTTISQKYFPVSYGNFNEDTSTPSAGLSITTLCEDRDLFPVPTDNLSGKILALTPRAYDGTSLQDGRLHHYEKDSDQFVPIYDSGFDDDTEVYQGGNAIRCATNLSRGFRAKPKTSTELTEFTDSDNAFDSRSTDSTTYATGTLSVSYTGSGSYTDNKTIKLTPPNIVGKLTELRVFVRYKLDWSDTASSESGSLIITSPSSDTITTSRSASVRTFTSADLISAYNSNNQQIPNINIQMSYDVTADASDSGTSTMTCQIYDVQYYFAVALDEANDQEGTKKYLDDLAYLYIGANGLAKDGWESSGEISEIHDAHRDMLIRYTGLTTTEPTGWTALNTARSGWNIRWWAVEPEELKKALEKIAYEGCFIFRFKADGSPQYIFVPDSSTADKTLTKNDIKDFQVKPSNFSNLLTKMDISYEKHPAENRYLTSVSSVNSTARTNWAVETKENIKQVKLDAYVAPAIPTTPSANPNDDFYSYYDNIFGDIKLVVSGSIVNPEFYNIEVGDIVDFSNMYPTKAFGQSWSGKNFMITGLTRSIGTLKFEGRAI